ncbi:hypothetical protein B7463_g3449, partial [Scytalidium lignicola]
MATVNNPPKEKDSNFDIVKTYERLLAEDPELTMPVAAIEALIDLLVQSRAVTVYETLDLVKAQSDYLKSQIPNSISLSAGTDLFQRYMISSLKPSSTGNFDSVRQHLLSNGRLFVSRAKASRERIASHGRQFVRDGTVVLTQGGSRVVGALLSKAADACAGSGSVRFKVIYVMNDGRSSESRAVVSSLRAKGVPVATISEGAVGYAIGKVNLVIVGAEGVVENGGIISRMGTYQIALLAKAAGKPFYVAAESHKFVRLYPLGQYDLGIEQTVIEFQTEDDDVLANGERKELKPVEGDDYFKTTPNEKPKHKQNPEDAVDFTPPALISALITESGVLTPSAVSEELISVWMPEAQAFSMRTSTPHQSAILLRCILYSSVYNLANSNGSAMSESTQNYRQSIAAESWNFTSRPLTMTENFNAVNEAVLSSNRERFREVDQDDKESESSEPSMDEITTEQRSRTLRRTHERIDGLNHLSVIPQLNDESSEANIHYLRQIVFCLVRLDLWIMVTSDSVSYPDNIVFTSSDPRIIKSLLPHHEIENWSVLGDWFEGQHYQERNIEKYVRGFSKPEALQRIKNLGTRSYMPRLLQEKLFNYRLAKSARDFAKSSTDFTIPKEALENQGPMERSEYIAYSERKHREAHYRLHSVYKTIVELSRHVTDAASHDGLDKDSLSSLKVKMAALQEHFPDVCAELGQPEQNLIWDTRPRWRKSQVEDLSKQFIDSNPSNIATAYPAASGLNRVLTFLIPSMSVLAMIPAALAWSHSNQQLGTISDADLYQLISSSAMQLLSIFTLIMPTIYNTRLARQEWFWVWVLASASTICSIVAIPLYLTTATKWSAAVSFSGNVMLALITLQLMFVV